MTDCNPTRFRTMEAGACRLGLALGLVLALATPGAAVDFAQPGRAGVVARLIEGDQNALRFEIVNQTPQEVHDVRLIVRHDFRWRNEYRPGPSPSSAETRVVPGPLAPGASLVVVHPLDPPLPRRDDGSFEPSVEVVHWREVVMRGAAR
jgi:hypothetical protein